VPVLFVLEPETNLAGKALPASLLRFQQQHMALICVCTGRSALQHGTTCQESLMNVKKSFAAIALAGAMAALPLAPAQVLVSVRIAPPVLPVYDQPVCPGDGYLWTPGYWAWDQEVSDYYWVPGTWVMAPQVGYLWTPGYWGFASGAYLWHVGYWGPHIGFYGGVNYGFGYFGTGYEGGYWNGPHFYYNTSINRVNVTVIHNTYVHNVTVVNNTHVAFNGGPNGINARPSEGEQAAFRENRMEPTGVQTQHADFARQDRNQFASTNHGQPPAAAMAHPAQSPTAFRAGGGAVVSGTRPTGPMNAGFPTNNGMQRSGYDSTGARAPVQGAKPAALPGYDRENHTPIQSTPAARPQAQAQPQPQSRPATESHPAPQSHPAPAPHGGSEHEHH
jgi:hypothetical protein